MDKIALSLKMKRFIPWLETGASPIAVFASNSMAGHSAALTSPRSDRQGTAASGNLNRVYLCGTEAGLQPDTLDRLIELFAAAA